MNRKKQNNIAIILAFAAVGIAFATWWFWGRDIPLPSGLIQANGRIEGDHYTVAPKVSGRIAQLLVREGFLAEKNQILTKMDDAQIKAKVEQSIAAVNVLKAQLKAAHTALNMMNKDVPLKIESAKAQVDLAQARLTAAGASAGQARREFDRRTKLLADGVVSEENSEQSALSFQVASADHSSADAALTQAQKSLAVANLGWEQIEVKKNEIAAVEAQVVQAEAGLAEARSVLDDLTIRAPAAGMITTRFVDEGEVIVAGAPIFDIVDMDRLYLKVYIPGNEIGKVRLGLTARIYTDAYPNEPFTAKVGYIASQAEFTPKEVQTPDERVKLVYAVKLYLEQNPKHCLTSGLPADAVIRWREDVPWAKPRW